MKPIPNQSSTGHRARKRFGQNFLVSDNVINDIIRSVSPKTNEQVIEIGPGLGALTDRLVSTGASVTAIELDRDLVDHLNQRFSAQENFTLINADALQVDFSTLSDKKLRVIGNLPYNISTPIMFHLLKNASQIQDMHFMLQKEVVNRLCGQPGTSAWGRLSIMVQYHCDVESLLDVPPGSFDPPPKVDSAVVRLSPRPPDKPVRDLKMLEKVVRIAFNMRRKTLRNALKGLFTEQQIRDLDIDPSLRPENLSLADYVTLANELND